MKDYTVNITQYFDSPLSEVFAVLADHNQLSKVLGVPVKRIKDGEESPNGVGSVRRLGPPPIGTQETVVTSVTNELIEYKISKFGGPVKNHHGRQTFAETDSGCMVNWVITFAAHPAIGAGIAKVLETGVKRGLAGLANRL